MKKIIIALILVMALIVCLPSCDSSNKYNEDLNTLNSLASIGAKSYTINIKVNSPEGESITEIYTVKYTNDTRIVSYKTEKLNGFIIDGENISAPNEYITVAEGTLDATESANAKYAFPSFNFTKKAISVNKVSNHGTYRTMQAKINSLHEFTGGSLEGSDASLTVKYDNYQITSIVISYVTSSGNTTTITYTVK